MSRIEGNGPYYPLGETTNYTYDTFLRVASVTDPKGQRFNYTYDNASHVTNVTFPNGTTANYTYSCCHLTQAQSLSGTLNFSYDTVGRLTQFTNQDNKTITCEYDSVGNLVNLTYPGNLTVSYEHDADNRLIKVTDWLGHNTTYNYDLAGRLISSVSPGVISIYKYDDSGRLSTLMNYNPGNLTVTSAFNFTLDANSNRQNIKQYLLLSNGTFSSVNTTYVYNTGNQLVTAGNKTFTYDDNGNMISISGSPVTNYTYNELNQLSEYSDGTANLTFTYDALGNRISKSNGGVTLKYVVAGASMSAETDAGGNVTSYYIYGVGLVSKINAASNSTYYYQYDGLGSTVAIANETGTIVNKYAYDDFGNVATNSVEGITNSFKYVGQYGVQTDAGDLLYMRARYYKPSVGRFINMDPIGLAGGMNQYFYSGNNPINFIDPTGLLGIGISGGGVIEGGIGSGGGAQYTGNVGVFVGDGIQGGAFDSAGAFGLSTPDTGILGGYAGLGLGGFLTNADSACELSGPGRTDSLNLGVISISLTTSGNIWVISVTFGPGLGADYSSYTTVTNVK